MSNRRVSLPGASELFRSTAKHNSFGDTDKAHDGLDDVEQRTSSDPDASARSGNGTRQTAAADASADAQGSTEDSRAATTNSSATRGTTGSRRGSGRVRHDEKITVYVSTEELLALENARLQLRAQGLSLIHI